MKKKYYFILIWFIMIVSNQSPGQSFDFKRILFESPSSLYAEIYAVNIKTGNVAITGYDSRSPSIPFTWDWGDGEVTQGWFQQNHHYVDLTKNYVLKIVSHYSASETDSVELLVRFAGSSLNKISLPESKRVIIPNSMVSLSSRMPGYGIPQNLTFFDDSFFPLLNRSDVEYVLTVAATIETEFANENVFLVDSNFNQVVLRDSDFGGMYSLWFTTPVSFGAGDYGFTGSLEWSSFFHEMGHNVTLNFPAHYYFGGKIDGSANAIYSETMAQIYQHSTAYKILNHYTDYGLGNDLFVEIKNSAFSSMKVVRQFYDDYLGNGKNFASWNDPATPNDETIYTFMTIAFKFCEHAEENGQGYEEPLKRMMEFLENFDESWATQYSQDFDTAEADTFRATMMVAAMAYAFDQDLRQEFRELNFPVSDEIYDQLFNYVGIKKGEKNYSSQPFELLQNFPNPFNNLTKIKFSLPKSEFMEVTIYNISGQKIQTLLSRNLKAGVYEINWDGKSGANEDVPSGVYFCKLKTKSYQKTIKLCLIK